MPKRYALIEHKNIKKGVVVTSAVKLAPEEVTTLLTRPKISPEYQVVWTIQRISMVGKNAYALKKWINFYNSNPRR